MQTRKNYLHRLMDLTCRGILGLVFLYAAFPKLLDLTGFASVIDAYGIVPDKALTPIAFVISILEVASGIGIFFKQSRFLSLCVISGLLLLFIGVLSYGIWLGLDIDCGCFGKDEPEYEFFSTLRTALYRDLFLLLPMSYLYWQGWHNRIRVKEIQNEDS